MLQKEKLSDKSSILVCLDGSPDSEAAAVLALEYARHSNSPIVAVHIYDARIHESRFRQMEPGLPPQYQAEEGLKELRESHGTLMSDGFQALSRGYMEGFLAKAREAGVQVQTVIEEGRNYIGLLRTAGRLNPGMVAFGAAGLGDLGDGNLGSTAARLIRKLQCDVLVGRASSPQKGPILACIDGSEHALKAFERSKSIARFLNVPVNLVAAYDPELHQRVFRAMADTMPPEAQEAVGLDKQQDLHESLIDDGLGTLYQQFLEEAAATVTGGEALAESHLVADKGYRGILRKADASGAGLICLGRFGHNREEGSDIGATAENVVRSAHCHVLVTAPAQTPTAVTAAGEELPWDPEALERLERVPRFVRKMAKRSIEAVACNEGAERVTVRHFEMVSERFRGKKKT